MEAIEARTKTTDEVLSAKIGCAREMLSVWRRKPAFVGWFHGELERHAGVGFSRVVFKLHSMALRGDLEAAKLLKQVLRPTPNQDGDDVLPALPAVFNGPQIIFNIPRPAGELAGRTIVHNALESGDPTRG